MFEKYREAKPSDVRVVHTLEDAPTSFEPSPKILHEDTVRSGGLLPDLYSD
jgi:hypothetical protein